jgi:hypothetical protein
MQIPTVLHQFLQGKSCCVLAQEQIFKPPELSDFGNLFELNYLELEAL